MLNQARLKALKVREDHVRNVLDEARKKLGEIIHDPGRYKEILQLLIIQGLYQVCTCYFYIIITITILLFIIFLYAYIGHIILNV